MGRRTNHSRAFGRRKDVILALTVLLICGIWFVWRSQNSRSANSAAQIYLDGALIDTIVLKETDHYRIDLMPDYQVPVSFLVQNGAIAFTDVTCPDHLCERTGYLSRVGEIAACMPNRTVVQIIPPA